MAPQPSTSNSSAFSFLPQGALIQEFNVSGHNIVLSFPTASLYATHNAPYFGETIGRTTNRIKNAEIKNLNGKTYQLAANDGPNCLHGGARGWGKKQWEGPKSVKRGEGEAVEFRYLSKDGEEGYPGTVEARVWYFEGEEEGKTVLEVEYEVEFVGDECEETVVGVTNHSYFNLNPSPSITGTIVTLATTHYLALDSNSIPTGAVIPHPSAPSAPNTSFTLGPTTPSFDDCFVLPGPPTSIPLDTRPLPLRPLCTLYHPDSRLHLEIESTEPAFQFYTGEGIDVPELTLEGGEKVGRRGARSGIAIEPSRYVDCAGREEWRGMCLLKRGEVWGARSLYRGWKG